MKVERLLSYLKAAPPDADVQFEVFKEQIVNKHDQVLIDLDYGFPLPVEHVWVNEKENKVVLGEQNPFLLSDPRLWEGGQA